MNGAATLHQIRRLILAIVLLEAIGLIAELGFTGHFESWQQWIPLVALGVGVLAGGAAAHRPVRPVLRAFQLAMGAVMIAGLAGLWLHYLGNVEWELERNPALGGTALVWEALRGATPALAPGAMVQLGLLGLVFTFRHPGLGSTTTSAKE